MECELLQKVLQAHGGLDRWNGFETVHATIVTGGQLFGMKGTPQDSTPRRMTVATRREWASVAPYGAADQRTDFTQNRVAIEKLDGSVVKERLNPSDHAEGKTVDAPWDALDRAYFKRYALWTLRIGGAGFLEIGLDEDGRSEFQTTPGSAQTAIVCDPRDLGCDPRMLLKKAEKRISRPLPWLPGPGLPWLPIDRPEPDSTNRPVRYLLRLANGLNVDKVTREDLRAHLTQHVRSLVHSMNEGTNRDALFPQ